MLHLAACATLLCKYRSSDAVQEAHTRSVVQRWLTQMLEALQIVRSICSDTVMLADCAHEDYAHEVFRCKTRPTTAHCPVFTQMMLFTHALPWRTASTAGCKL